MKRPGFTIVELLVYMGLTTAAVLMFMNFMIDISRVATRTKVAKEVDQQARYVMGRITSDIRNAVSAPVISGTSNEVLTIDLSHTCPPMPIPIIVDRITYSYSAGDNSVTYQRTTCDVLSPVTKLTSASVRVTALTFTRPITAGQPIKLNLTVESPISAPPPAQKQLTLESTIQPHKSLY